MKKVQIPTDPITPTDQYLARIVQQNDEIIRLMKPAKSIKKPDEQVLLKEG